MALEHILMKRRHQSLATGLTNERTNKTGEELVMPSRTMLIAAILLAAISFCAGDAWAGTAKDGRYYFDELKSAMLKVLADNQKLINANPDGSVKSDKLLPDAVYTDAYQTFKTVMGSEFSLGALDGETDPEKVAGALTALLQAARDTIAKIQQPINTEADGSVKLKKFIPAVFGRLTLEEFKIGIGTGLAASPLPHHRTCGSAYGGSAD